MDIPGFRVIKPRVRERERQTRVQAILGYIEIGPSNHSERAHSTTRFKVRAEVELRDPDVTRIGF